MRLMGFLSNFVLQYNVMGMLVEIQLYSFACVLKLSIHRIFILIGYRLNLNIVLLCLKSNSIVPRIPLTAQNLQIMEDLRQEYLIYPIQLHEKLRNYRLLLFQFTFQINLIHLSFL